jgi:pterin-4a-carbinolamine dehydratase
VNERAPLLFISYRRQDTQWIARPLHRYLSERLGSPHIFMDTVEIRSSDQWRTSLNVALERASLLLVIIGRQWLRLTDDYGRLRIDNRDDWVRNEVRTALEQNKKIIVLYVDGAQRITDSKALPDDIARLLDIQSIVLSEDNWDRGLLDLVAELGRCSFTLYNTAISLPERRKIVTPLSKIELDAIPRTLPPWTVTTSYFSPGHRDTPIARTELYREYRFKSFPQATQFMAETSPMIEQGQHHPRWENIWTTVRVWLSTWDIEFQPSSFDVKLARELDAAYETFKRRAS